MRYCDEQDFGFGWIDEGGTVPRTSHALVVRRRRLADRPGRVAGRRRARARRSARCAACSSCSTATAGTRAGWRTSSARRTTSFRPSSIDGAPFEFLPVARRVWREVALWWPERRVLVCADAVGTLGYFRAPGERIGLHPLLRLWPPRSLRRVYPRHVLTGHGEGVHEDATPALHAALQTARRRLPAAWWTALRRAVS